ncbi:hypothetical protein EAI_13477 [Harpegnathos saltator]|uniref:Uncharacterized protein n=1 Tax=Harpegnathos saltator TaxID=610380 RepID=E2BRF6_HARSA|nr:hypothetical protein EAI_13477 [Harpegnathos saltator]
MEPEQRGHASRASSTSSLGREVRCGCQYYQSDSLLPERRALLVRPSSRTMQQPPGVRCSEHEYEPIAPPPPSLPHPAMAPVVRISDTDVMPVADSDDSIDDRGRLPPELILDGDVVLPLDGKIEDSAMEGRELGETCGDTSEEQEPTAQQLQDRLEERFLDAPAPHTESRTDGEVNSSQVDSSAMEELPPRRGARGLPQCLRTQAGKLRSRLRGFQRPTFTFPQRQKKPEKTARSSASGGGKSDKSRTASEKRPSRMDRIRTSISERTKFSLPDRPKFSLPDRSKFHLPERPKFNFPDKSRFRLPDRSKFTIKKPSIRLADALARVKRPASLREQQKQRSTESTAGSKRNIFDFATYPRIFDKKSKKRGEYATSSPKDSRAQSAEIATFPRARKGRHLGARWTRAFGNSSSQDRAEAAASDESPPWHQTSIEEPREPRLSARTEEEIMAAARAIPWEDTRKREERRYDEEEIQYMDYEQESSQEVSDRQPPPRRSHKASRRKEESYEHEEPVEEDPRLYGDEEARHVHRDEVEEEDLAVQDDWHANQQMMMPEEKFRPIPRSRSLDEDMPRALDEVGYEGAFMAVDPRRFRPRKIASEEKEEEKHEEELEEDLEEHEPSSMQSNLEQQQSSGSSCDRRRRGVIEEIDSDEFFLRASGISQDDMNLGSYLPDEIRDALRAEIVSALQDEEMPPTPPQRPMRTRSLRKREEKDSTETAKEVVPPRPARPKRERGPTRARRSREASIVDEVFRERTRSDSRSDSRHRVVYQAEGAIQSAFEEQEPLDDIVVVKPVRRKSRSSLRSHSQPPMETSILSSSIPAIIVPTMESSSSPFLPIPPAVPVRRKRSHRETVLDRRNGDVVPICNGHREWGMESAASKKPTTPARRSRSRQSLTEQQQQQMIADGDVVALASREDVDKLIGARNVAEPTPVPPKRRSRSRTTSVAADEDRTSHGAESLPEAGYIEEDIPPDETSSARDLSGYAIVEKRERPPRPPPPRRKRDKFATSPRPIPPKRPQRAYSTLGPARSRTDTSDTITSETITASTTPVLLSAVDSTPYIEIDSDDVAMEHRDAALRDGGVLDKIQGRPLPAPPRPPRSRKEHLIVERPRTPFEFAVEETTAATQTDPLPDDVVIEEEVTQAKLIVTPSRSGSQVMVSMERIPSPSRTGTPPVPPLPLISQILRKEQEEEQEKREDEVGRMAYDTVSLTSPSPTRETERTSRHMSAPHLEERREEEEELRSRAIRSALFSDEPLRISSLEVGDLKVDRLSVSQIEAHKIMASEVDAMVIATSELRGGSAMEQSLSPAIIRELIAIRSHLETVATSQTQERHHESEREKAVSRQVTDIPTSEDSSQAAASRERRFLQERSQGLAEETSGDETVEPMRNVELPSVEDAEEMPEAGEDQKVVKTDVLDIKDKEVPHTPSLASPDSLLSQTLAINQLKPTAQDKSLRILDSEHLLTLSSRTTSGSHVVDESRASFPPSSDVPTTRSSELRVSPERTAEPTSSSDQTTTTTTSTSTTTTTTTTTPTATATATESTATSMCLHRSDKDDVSDSKELRKSRSRSPSPARGIRQTASPVRSLPPVISVTPDTPDSTPGHGISTDARPQRAVISYSSDTQHGAPKYAAQPQRAVISHSSDTGRPPQTGQRESSQSPVPSLPLSPTHFIAFPASEIPAQFFSLSDTPTSQRDTEEPGVIDTTQQLLRALRTAGLKAMRHFVRYLASTLSSDDTVDKIREVELAICALLLFIAGLLIYYFSSARTVTYYHHWDYFNPPQ